jgi:hypothetical protein
MREDKYLLNQIAGIMRRTRVLIALVCCLLAMTALAMAQGRKTGLWDLTTTTTWQESPFPAGTPGSPAAGGAHTMPVCFTQQQMDKYAAIIPPISDCHVSNLVKKANGMTAEMVCTGRMSGKASLESSWTDGEHATGKVHFVGSMQVGSNNKAIEWTSASSSVYKSADCGSVKPYPLMPDK